MRFDMSSFFPAASNDGSDFRSAADVLEPLLGRIERFGYGSIFEEWEASRSVEDLPPLVGEGSAAVNVIPGRPGAGCTPVLLALSRGRRGPLGFDAIMREVKTHLIRCGKLTKFVIFFCDAWDSRSFRKKDAGELRAHHAKGVRFVFIMAGEPDRLLARVPVDLA